MKKQWLNPESSELNLNQTYSTEALDCEYENEEERRYPTSSCNHVCPKCRAHFGNGFGSHSLWTIHKSICDFKNNGQGGPGSTEGLLPQS